MKKVEPAVTSQWQTVEAYLELDRDSHQSADVVSGLGATQADIDFVFESKKDDAALWRRLFTELRAARGTSLADVAQSWLSLAPLQIELEIDCQASGKIGQRLQGPLHDKRARTGHRGCKDAEPVLVDLWRHSAVLLSSLREASRSREFVFSAVSRDLRTRDYGQWLRRNADVAKSSVLDIGEVNCQLLERVAELVREDCVSLLEFADEFFRLVGSVLNAWADVSEQLLHSAKELYRTSTELVASTRNERKALSSALRALEAARKEVELGVACEMNLNGDVPSTASGSQNRVGQPVRQRRPASASTQRFPAAAKRRSRPASASATGRVPSGASVHRDKLSRPASAPSLPTQGARRGLSNGMSFDSWRIDARFARLRHSKAVTGVVAPRPVSRSQSRPATAPLNRAQCSSPSVAEEDLSRADVGDVHAFEPRDRDGRPVPSFSAVRGKKLARPRSAPCIRSSADPERKPDVTPDVAPSACDSALLCVSGSLVRDGRLEVKDGIRGVDSDAVSGKIIQESVQGANESVDQSNIGCIPVSPCSMGLWPRRFCDGGSLSTATRPRRAGNLARSRSSSTLSKGCNNVVRPPARRDWNLPVRSQAPWASNLRCS